MGKCISKPVPLDDVSAPEKRKSIDDEVPLRKSDRALLLLFNKEEDDTDGHLKGIPEEDSPAEEQGEQYPHQDLTQNAQKPTASVGSTLETIVESKSPDEEQVVEEKAEGQEEGAKAEHPVEVEKKERSSEKPDAGTDDDKHSVGTQCEIVKVDNGHAVQEAKESEAAGIDKEERPSTPEISESKSLLQEADTQLKESDANAQNMELTANVDDAENRNSAKVIDLIKEDSEKFELIFKQISDKFEIAGIPEQEAEQLVAETKAEGDEPASVEPEAVASVEPEAVVSGDLQHDEELVQEIDKASEIQEKTEAREAVVETESDISATDLHHSVQDDDNKDASCNLELKDEPEQQPESILVATTEDSSTSDEPRDILEETDGTSEAVVIGELQHDEAPVEEIDKATEIQEKTDEHEAVVEPESATDLQHLVQDEVPVEEKDNKDASCNMELKDEPEQPMVVATAEDSSTSDEPREILEKTDGASVEPEAVVIGELQHDEAPGEEIGKASEVQENREEHKAVVEPESGISATDLHHPVQDEVPVEENDNKDAQPESIVIVTAEDSSTSDEPRETFEKTDGASAVVIGELQHDKAPVEEIDKASEIQEKTDEHESVESATELRHPVQDEVPVEENANKDASCNIEFKDEPEPMVVATAEGSSTSDEPREVFEKTEGPEAVVRGRLQHEAHLEEIDKGEIQQKTEEHEAVVEPESGISATELQHPVQDEVPVEENDNKDASCIMEFKEEPKQQPDPLVVAIGAAEVVVESTEAAVETPTTEKAAESVEQHDREDESAHQNISDEDHRSETTVEDGKASIEDTNAVQEEAEVQHAETQGNESSSESNALEEPAAANDTVGDHKLEDEKVSKKVSEPNAIEELAQGETSLETGEENETLHAEPGGADGDGSEQHAETQAIQESSALEEPAVAETNEGKKADLEDESQVEPQNMTSSSTDADGKSPENPSQTEHKEDDAEKKNSAEGTQHVGNEGADSAREQITPDVDNVVTPPAGLLASEDDKRELHGEVPSAPTKTADIEPDGLVSEAGFPKDIISNEAEEPTNLADKENVENDPQEPETLKHAVIDEPDSAHEKMHP